MKKKNNIGVKLIYNFYGMYKGGMAGSVYDINGLSPCLTTFTGGVSRTNDNRI